MIVCPKCGSVAERDTAGNIVCTCQNCNWSEYISNKTNKTSEYISNKTNKIQNDFIQPRRVEKDEKKMNEMLSSKYAIGSNSNVPLRYYFVEYIGAADSEFLQANYIYDLIEKMLKQEGEFTPFVEKCYCAFTKSSVSELIQFYNHFSEFTIEKISELENLNVVYEKEIK